MRGMGESKSLRGLQGEGKCAGCGKEISNGWVDVTGKLPKVEGSYVESWRQAAENYSPRDVKGRKKS